VSELTAEEVLRTTRAARKTLDLSRPVPRELLLECVEIAIQAPVASNLPNWHFVMVTDRAKKEALAALYSKAWEMYQTMPGSAVTVKFPDPTRQATQDRVAQSADFLANHLADVPVLVIPCLGLNIDQVPRLAQAAMWGSILPAAWNFMLAAHTRGLGTSLTTLHLFYEAEAAEILGIDYGSVTQAGLIPTGFLKEGTRFKPGPRDPVAPIVHWDTW
jgi:nitroreductase